MKIKNISPCIVVKDVSESREYYTSVFGAEIVFDCGWYLNVKIAGQDLCFMEPQPETQALFNGTGLTYNFEIEDVDAEYQRLLDLEQTVVMPLEDHPWGDRGF